MLENRKPLDSFLVGVRVLDQYYLENLFNVPRKIWNVLEESVDLVILTRTGLIFCVNVLERKKGVLKTEKDIGVECFLHGFP